MNLRQAAEMALEYFEDAYGLEDEEVAIKEALREALAHHVDNVYMSEERVHKTEKSIHEPVAWMKPSGLVSPYKHGSYQIPLYAAPPRKRSFNEDVGRLLSTGKGFYDDGTPIDHKEINMKIEGVGDGVVVCTEVHLPRPPQKDWVGLTEEEGAEIWADAHDIDRNRLVTPKEIVRRIEAKLREKNT